MKYFRPFIIFFGAIIAWQFVIYITNVPFYILPSPISVLKSIYSNYELLYFHSIVTAIEIIMGLILGAFLGIFSALLMSYYLIIRRWLLPVLVISQALPVFAIAPILVLWIGYDMGSKIAMATLIIYFPVTAALLDGLANTNQGYLDLANTMNAGKISTLLQIRIPHALPSLASGIKVATSVAPIGAVVGEWVGASKGLGYLMLHANGRLQIDLMFSALFILGLIAVALYFCVDYAMTRILLKFSLVNPINS